MSFRRTLWASVAGSEEKSCTPHKANMHIAEDFSSPPRTILYRLIEMTKFLYYLNPFSSKYLIKAAGWSVCRPLKPKAIAVSQFWSSSLL